MDRDEIRVQLRALAIAHGYACDGNDVTERYFAKVWNLAVAAAEDAASGRERGDSYSALDRIRALRLP